MSTSEKKLIFYPTMMVDFYISPCFIIEVIFIKVIITLYNLKV